jgi:uncharacterized protein YecT (DUF1311 family)
MKMKVKALLKIGFTSIIFFVQVSALFATDIKRKIHPIALKERNCLGKESSTQGMRECYNQALSDWDSELNTLYQKLMSHLKTSKEKNSFKTSQKSWIHFRDQELVFIRDYYSVEEGTVWSLVTYRMAVNLTRNRVRQLYALLESKDLTGDSSMHYVFETEDDN